MEIRLLGPLDVVGDDGGAVPVAAGKVKALLALLALDAGGVVPTDRLVEALWDGDPPRGAANALQGLVSRLRRALGAGDLVAMSGSGYVLKVDPGVVDAHRFEELVGAGRRAAAAGELEPASGLLARAEELWRGPALADFPYEEFAQAARARLDEMRLAAVEVRVDLDLDRGRHDGLVVDLEALVAEHPLRERLRRQLMVALYREGRQADALRVFQEGRRVLADELGLDPGPDLRRVESAILSHDPALAGPALAPAPAPAPAPATGPAPVRTTVPAPIASLVGREAELATLSALVAESRLVTVVGAGGAGKTRLAVELARTHLDTFTDGAWLVELAPVRGADEVTAALATGLLMPDARAARGGGVEAVAAFVGERRVLVVVDNCEHVVAEAAAAVAILLGACPGLSVLATSREPLRVDGEVVWPIPPLPLADAVELFAQRARSANRTFTLPEGGGDLAADICGHLDGLPLAIELAAARTRAFPLAQIADRLDDRFRLLTGGARTALPRQQTLRAVVDWSYDLLFDDERRVFQRLSVFAGGCTLEAAQAVCADDELDDLDVADVIATLIDKSLVVADHRGPETRYTLLETLAHYGRERLAQAGGAEATEQRMVEWYAALCRRSEAAITGGDQAGWLAAARVERPNLRVALDWAIAHGDADLAAGVVAAVGWFWWLTGRAGEGSRWIDAALAGGAPATPAGAWAVTWRWYFGFLSGERPRFGHTVVDEMSAVFGEVGDDTGAVVTTYLFASVLIMQGQVDEGVALLERAVATLAGMPPTAWTEGESLLLRATAALATGDTATGVELLSAGADRLGDAGDLWGRALALYELSIWMERRDDLPAARACLDGVEVVCDALDLPGLRSGLLARRADVALAAGDLDDAGELQDRALALGHELAYPPVIARARNSAGRRLLLQGRPEEAAEEAAAALAIYGGFHVLDDAGRRVYGYPPGVAVALSTLGRAALDRGEVAEALVHHTEALRVALLTGDEHLVQVARADLAATAAVSAG